MQGVDKVEHRELCALEPVGLDVFGKHAFRRVDGEDYVNAAHLGFLPAVAPLGAGQGDENKHYPQ